MATREAEDEWWSDCSIMWMTGHSPLTREHARVAAFFTPLLIITVLLSDILLHSVSRSKNTLYLDTTLSFFAHLIVSCEMKKQKYTWHLLNVPFWLPFIWFYYYSFCHRLNFIPWLCCVVVVLRRFFPLLCFCPIDVIFLLLLFFSSTWPVSFTFHSLFCSQTGRKHIFWPIISPYNCTGTPEPWKRYNKWGKICFSHTMKNCKTWYTILGIFH